MATAQETKWYEETTVELMAPTMLPELHLLKRVKPDTNASRGKIKRLNLPKKYWLTYISFVSGKSERTSLLGAVCGPQQGHGAPEVRAEVIKTQQVQQRATFLLPLCPLVMSHKPDFCSAEELILIR